MLTDRLIVKLYVQTDATTPNFVGPTIGSCCLCLHVAKSLTGFKLCATELPTACNRVCKWTQQITSNNVGSVCTEFTLYYVVNFINRRDESKQVSFHQFQRVALLEVVGWFQAFQGFAATIGVRAGGARGALAPPKFWATQLFLGSKRKLGQSLFLKTSSCLFNYFEDLNINLKSA